MTKHELGRRILCTSGPRGRSNPTAGYSRVHMAVRQGTAALAVLLALGGTASAPAHADVSVMLGLKRDDQGLTRFVERVSNPASAQFRQYADVPQLARRFGASPDTRRSVLSWLRSKGLRGRVGATGAWVEAIVPERRAERLFDTRLVARAGRVSPARTPRVPAGLRDDVAEVVGLDQTPDVHTNQAVPVFPPADLEKLDQLAREKGSSLRANTGTPSGCAEGKVAGHLVDKYVLPAYTPNQYLHAYGYDKLHRRGLRGQGQRLALIEIDGFARADIEAFGKCFGKRVPPTKVHRVGLKKNLVPGDETVLDLEVITAAAPGLDGIDVMETNGTDRALIAAYARVLKMPKARRPSVISASLGQCEPEFNGSVGAIGLYEHVFKMVAAAGISNVASTGDTGSSGCAFDENGNALALLAVQHPAVSPYVTAVGGTNLELNAKNEIVDEITWRTAPLGFGGGTGGHSIFFERPSWQTGPGIPKGRMRIVPDIAMLADSYPGYVIYCTSKPCDGIGWTAVGGTSAATPLFASAVAIANQQADKAGTPRLGFLNPTLYALGGKAGPRKAVFRDVLKTTNDLGTIIPPQGGGGSPLGCCGAHKGHDAATGWGSVYVDAFSRAARRLLARSR